MKIDKLEVDTQFSERFQKTPNNEALQKCRGKNEFTQSSECEFLIAKKKKKKKKKKRFYSSSMSTDKQN